MQVISKNTERRVPDPTEPRNQRELIWEPLERPVGPVDLPAWVKDIHVNWNEGFSNGPDYWIFCTHDIGDWPGKRWKREGHFYRAYHPDGFVEQHAHDGQVRPTVLKAWRNPDGTMSQYRGHEGGELVEAEFAATSQQQGYAGRHYWLKMEDGTDLVLRGPWWGGKPDGYDAASVVTPKYSGCRRPGEGPWYKGCTPTFGLLFKHELIAAIFARFQAHLPLALVTHYGSTRIEPYREEWGRPKGAKVAIAA